MTTDPLAALRAATRRYKSAQARAEWARVEQWRLVKEAADAGAKQADIVAVTGHSREHIRKIVAGAYEQD